MHPYRTLILLGVLAGCQLNPLAEGPSLIDILSPSEGAVFAGETAVLLAVKGSSSAAQWSSDLQGPLGTGSPLSLLLSPGNHRITVRAPGRLSSERQITVLAPRPWRHYQVTQNPFLLSLKPGQEGFWLSSLADNAQKVKISGQEPEGTHNRLGLWSRRALNLLPSAPQSRTLQALPSLGNQRTFFIANPEGNGYEGWQDTFQMVALSNEVFLWVPTDKTEAQYWSGAWDQAERLVWARLKALWGSWGDIDQNGGIHLIMTDRLTPASGVVGFFNPLDLYPRNQNPEDEHYNPISNEGETLYVGIPSMEPEARLFSVAGIAATMAHEAQHLIYFYNQTYSAQVQGQAEPPLEDSWLAEGLAHLTESYCGLGVSGGNLAFVARYLESPGSYSLTGADAWGRSDSAGKRGMAALFLDWLVRRQGGWKLHESPSGPWVEDSGGLTWLRALSQTGKTGWQNLKQTLPEAEALFLEWAGELGSQSTGRIPQAEPSIPVDPITNEPLGIDPWAGQFEPAPGWSFSLIGPQASVNATTYSILPYSFQWWASTLEKPRLEFDRLSPILWVGY